MGYAVKIYELFRSIGEEQARILAEFVEYVESKKAATSEELKETELRLQKEIRETELRLQKEIESIRLEVEQVRKELKETELRLQKEIKETELRLRKEISETKATLIKWMFAFWTGQIIAIAGLLRFFLR
jgi:DNA-binding Xre family transcriptional regulator